jgi:DNA-3-methyladenine glycosylase I
MSYCNFCKNLEDENLHKKYHDMRYGFPIQDDDELFGRLILEINQAGLSWETILKKEENFRIAFEDFSINEIAQFDHLKFDELINNSGIVRNKLKINAVIKNAEVVIKIQQDFGSFKNWLDENHPKTIEEWVKLFKKYFTFVGGEIVKEFLMSTGYLKGAHDENCDVYHKILKVSPKWNVL